MIVKRQCYKECLIEQFLMELHLPKKLINDLINNKRIVLNGNILTFGSNIKKNEEISIVLDNYDVNDIIPYKYDIKVIYEDSDIIIVNKERGILIHSDGNTCDTLLNAISYYYRGKDIGKIRVIHRIDMETTGIVVFTKNIISYHYLNYQMENGLIKKQYIALVKGVFNSESGVIDYPIGSNRHYNNRYVVSKNGKKAITKYKVIDCKNNISKLLVTIETGRTHQIRVHMAYINHPIIGDSLYGDGDKLMLHSYLLGFMHPESYKYIEYKLLPSEDYNI